MASALALHQPRPACSCTVLAVLLAACAAPPPLAPPKVPPALEAPDGAKLHLEALASGVQIYLCSRKADSTYEWAFKAPEATLATRTGQPLGKHYAGPTWEAADGSLVVGEVKARAPGPVASAIPWLLLSAKSASGSGLFAGTRFIQRVDTAGGLAPVGGCGDATMGREARVPYTASYTFYR